VAARGVSITVARPAHLAVKRRPPAGALSSRQQQQATEELSRADFLSGMSAERSGRLGIPARRDGASDRLG